MNVPRHVAVRVDLDTLARIDALVPSLSTPWHTAKRSDALRYLIDAGLRAVEAQAKRTTRAPGPSSGRARR